MTCCLAAPRYFLSQNDLLWTEPLGINFIESWNYRNKKEFIEEDKFENIIGKMAAMFSWLYQVNSELKMIYRWIKLSRKY